MLTFSVTGNDIITDHTGYITIHVPRHCLDFPGQSQPRTLLLTFTLGKLVEKKMYRTAAKRFLYGATSGNISAARIGSLPNLQNIISFYPFSTSSPDPHSVSNQPPNLEIPHVSNSSSSSSSTAGESRRFKRQRPGVDYQDEQARVLKASLRHVVCVSNVSNLIF